MSLTQLFKDLKNIHHLSLNKWLKYHTKSISYSFKKYKTLRNEMKKMLWIQKL